MASLQMRAVALSRGWFHPPGDTGDTRSHFLLPPWGQCYQQLEAKAKDAAQYPRRHIGQLPQHWVTQPQLSLGLRLQNPGLGCQLPGPQGTRTSSFGLKKGSLKRSCPGGGRHVVTEPAGRGWGRHPGQREAWAERSGGIFDGEVGCRCGPRSMKCGVRWTWIEFWLCPSPSVWP